MRTILFPTDFSEIANNAFVYALNIAKSIDAKIYVLYSFLEPVLSATHAGQPELLGEVYQTIELDQFEVFRKKSQRLHEIAERENLSDVELIFLFEEGPLPFVVQRLVQKEKFNLIVMGTHGESGFLSKVIGTNTVDVIKNVQNPVLAIPPHAKFQGLNKAAFTTLFRDKDKSALKEMLIMANATGSKIDCVHVIKSETVDQVLLHTEAWKHEFPNEEINYVLLDEVESVENTITTYLLENNIDIFAVVKRNRNWFDRLFSNSISNNLAFHSKVPILVFHEER